MVHWVKELEIYSLFQMKAPSLNDESRTCSPLDWIHYRLYPVPVPFPLPSPTKYIYIFDQAPWPQPSAFSVLRSNPEEWITGDERARAGKALFLPSPHISGSYSFMTKPIHALTACVLSDVWCCLLPPSRPRAPGSPLLCPLLPPQLCPVYRSDRMWRWFGVGVYSYMWREWYMTEEIRWWREFLEICLRSRRPRRVNMNEGEKWMLLPLFLCVHVLFTHISFCEHTTPAVSLADPVKAVKSEGGYRWIDLPSQPFIIVCSTQANQSGFECCLWR